MHSHESPTTSILDPSKILVDVEFVAAILGDVVGTVYNKAPVGELPFPCYKVGRSLRFKYSEVMEWVDSLQPAPIVRTKKPIKKPSNEPYLTNATKRGRGRPAGTTKAALKQRKGASI